MITYANHSSVRYAPQLIPKNIAWGPRLLYDDMSNYLCLEGHQEPLNVWVVGRICGLWFQGKNGPVDRASVTVIPLTSNDAKLVTKFVRALANPPEGKAISSSEPFSHFTIATPPSDATSLRFSRWMSRNMNPVRLVYLKDSNTRTDTLIAYTLYRLLRRHGSVSYQEGYAQAGHQDDEKA